jgi:hypothetical protein
MMVGWTSISELFDGPSEANYDKEHRDPEPNGKALLPLIIFIYQLS